MIDQCLPHTNTNTRGQAGTPSPSPSTLGGCTPWSSTHNGMEGSSPCLHVHVNRPMAGVHGLAFFVGRSTHTHLQSNRYGLLEHNVAAMGLQAKVRTHQGDFLRLLPQLQQDVVFLDPPWVRV